MKNGVWEICVLVPVLSLCLVTAWKKDAQIAVGHVIILDNHVVLGDKINLRIHDVSSGNIVI